MDRMRDQRDGEDWYNIYRTYDEVRVKLEEIANSSEIASTLMWVFEIDLLKGLNLVQVVLMISPLYFLMDVMQRIDYCNGYYLSGG